MLGAGEFHEIITNNQPWVEIHAYRSERCRSDEWICAWSGRIPSNARTSTTGRPNPALHVPLPTAAALSSTSQYRSLLTPQAPSMHSSTHPTSPVAVCNGILSCSLDAQFIFLIIFDIPSTDLSIPDRNEIITNNQPWLEIYAYNIDSKYYITEAIYFLQITNCGRNESCRNAAKYILMFGHRLYCSAPNQYLDPILKK